MDCSSCHAPNPDTAKYCSECGFHLETTAAETLEATVKKEVEVALERERKDLRIAEFDITEKVATRLLGWARWSGRNWALF